MLANNIFEQESKAPRSSSPRKHSQTLALAASQPIIFQPVISQLKKDGLQVIICSTYQELLQKCTREKPAVLVLGTFPEDNPLEIYRRCRNQWQHLPVILLVNQPTVSDSFKSWAQKRGISHVVSGYPQAFAQLCAAIKDVAETVKQSQESEISLPPPPSLEDIFLTDAVVTATETMELAKAIAALNQLTEYSKRHFGPLVIGNYWKKTRNSLVETHDWLNQWTIDYNGKINYIANSPQPVELTPSQYQSLQAWAQAFLHECQRVVGYFTQMLQNKQLSPEVDRLIASTRYP